MPRTHHPLLLLILCVTPACQDNTPKADLPGEDFQRDTDVRVTWPSNGETVESPFTLTFDAGDEVRRVWLEADDEALLKPTSVSSANGQMVLALDGGRHRLALVGADSQDHELSRHSLTIRVAEETDSWVTITSPPDGAYIPNPVTFAVSASSDVDSVELFADGWTLGTVSAGGILTWDFSGTGYERQVEARAYRDSSVVATDSIDLTVDPGTDPPESAFNQLVVDILESYPRDGTHDYYWPTSGDWPGTTRDIWYLDTLVAEGDPQGRCYCVGITWEVYMRAFESADGMTGGEGWLNTMGVDALYDFRTDWYVRDLWGAGAQEALANYGLGEPVTRLEDLQRGDFIQLWRFSGSGHSVIFDGWLQDDDGNIEGVSYWSCQGSTDGIGYNSEYFGSSGSYMDPSFFFAGRGWMPQDWLSW